MMSYTQPSSDNLNFVLDDYVVPSGDSVDFELGDEGPAPTSPTVKVYDGTGFEEKPLKYWDGTSWEEPSSINTWDGTQWVNKNG